MSTERDLTFEDVLRYAGMNEAFDAAEAAEAAGGASACGCSGGGGSGGASACGCSGGGSGGASACGCSGGGGGGSCGAGAGGHTIMDKPVDRRRALGMLLGMAAVGSQAAAACTPLNAGTEEEREQRLLEWQEYLKGNFARLTDEEREATLARLERLAQLRQGVDVSISGAAAQPGVEYGYAFNISKCKGYRNCVEACIEENNLDRAAGTQYIRIFEMEQGEIDLDHADAGYEHEVPAEGTSTWARSASSARTRRA
jgi:hypothetical protein